MSAGLQGQAPAVSVEGLPRHLRSLDILRGVAALWVVLFHIWNRYYPGLNTQKLPVQSGLDWSASFASSFFSMQFGYLGVTLFFVLSGFCIHLPQARQFAATGRDNLQIASFMRRRFWRLYPAYLASIVLAVCVLAVFPTILWLTKGKPFDIASTLQLKNALISSFFMQHLWPSALQLNGVYWTLLFEVQFYLLYPLMLLVMRRIGVVPLLLLLLGVEAWSSYHPPAIDHLFFTRYFEWFLGVWAAELLLGFKRLPQASGLAWLGACGLVAGLTSVFFPPVFDLRDVLVSSGFCILLLAAVLRDAQGKPALPFLPGALTDGLEYSGKVSYSLYLVHVPMIDLVWNGMGLLAKYGLVSPFWAAALAIVSIPISVWVAGVFFRRIEEPYMKFGHRR